MKSIISPYNSTSGNVLFLILIAVALFAALSYAVTQSTRSGGGDASAEKSQTEAATLLSYASLVRQGYQRMKVINGCSAYDNPDYNGFRGDPNIYPGKCNIYDKDGGGVPYNVYPSTSPLYTTGPTTGEGRSVDFITMFVHGVGSASGAEVELVIYNINSDICKAVNKTLGIKTADGQPPLEDSPYEGGFGGPITPSCCDENNSGVSIGSYNYGTNELVGKMEGCYRAERNGVMGNHFYSVIDSN